MSNKPINLTSLNNYDDQYKTLLENTHILLNDVAELTDSCKTILSAIGDHNNNLESHPDLRHMFGGDIIDSVTLREELKEHNDNPDTHKALEDKLMLVINNAEKAKELLTLALQEHNVDGAAHSNIRQLISDIATNIGDINIQYMNSQVSILLGEVGAGLQQRLQEIENTNVLQDDDITDNLSKISMIQTKIEELDDTVYTLSTLSNSTSNLPRIALDTYANDMNARLGFIQNVTDGPDMTGFFCTLPEYLGRNYNMEFTFGGASGDNGVTYTIYPGTSNATFSATSDITEDQVVTITTDGSGVNNEIRHIIVDITNTSTGVVVQRCVPYYVASPVNLNAITFHQLPTYVEPDGRYVFRIRNTEETGGRFTYTLNKLATEVSFTYNGDVANTDEMIVMNIPPDDQDVSIRGTTLSLSATIHDKYNNNTSKSFNVEVNMVPDADNLESNLPEIVIPGQAYRIYFSGITSNVTDRSLYNLKEIDASITFSKVDNILPNERVTMTISDEAIRGDELNFTLLAVDEHDAAVAIPMRVSVNILPRSVDIVSNLPTKITGGIQTSFVLDMGSDPDGQIHDYKLIAGPGLTVSKTENITKGEEIFLTINRVTDIVERHIDVYSRDLIGEYSSEPKRFTIEVSPVFAPEKPTIFAPTAGADVNVGFTMQVSQFKYSIDESVTV